jgi:hypothetical protein
MDELISLLETWNLNQGRKMGQNTRIPKWLPDVVIKYGVERVENANRLRRIIAEKSLLHIGIPHKFLYHIPGRPTDINNENYLVIAQRILRAPSRYRYSELNQNHVHDIYKLAMHGPHYDMHALNWILTEETQKVYIIDTDMVAMPNPEQIDQLHEDWCKHFDRLEAPGGGIYLNPEIVNHPLVKIRLHMMSKHCCFDDDAYRYMASKIEKSRQRWKDLQGRLNETG